MSAVQTKVNNSAFPYRWIAGGLGAILVVTLVFLLGMAQSTQAKVDNHESRISTIEGSQTAEHKALDQRLDRIEKQNEKIIILLGGINNAKR